MLYADVAKVDLDVAKLHVFYIHIESVLSMIYNVPCNMKQLLRRIFFSSLMNG